MLTGNILITGGAGFLGRGIVRRAEAENWPCRFTVYSRDEQKQDKMRQRWPAVRYVLGDITDLERLALVAAGHDTIIHAAAIKYIPEGEFNVNECVRVNIDGSRSVFSAARMAGVSTVVAVSTDKAVLPINAYGMTKAVMERLMSEASALDPITRYVGCRYGNVIGSTGSVIPVFQRQLGETGKITITDPEMTRFWISVDDAVDLIDAAANEADDGAIVIPQPKSMRLDDLANTIIRAYAGARDDYSRFTDIIGKRPGEKMHEDLLSESERLRTIRLGTYFQLLPPGKESFSEVPRLTSEAPYEWLDEDEMLELMQDADTV